jgi:hypothetical protein
VDGKPVTVRTFAHPRLLDGQFESFLNAMCMEADLAHRTAAAAGKENAATPASVEDILKMVNAINQANEEVSPTSAANRNGVRRSSAGGNLNCYLEAAPLAKGEESAEAKKALIPITQDWTGK